MRTRWRGRFFHGARLVRQAAGVMLLGLSAVTSPQEPVTALSVADGGVPWNLRYVLKIDAPYFFDIRATRGRKRLARQDRAQEQEIEAILPRIQTYFVENDALEREAVFATMLLEFERNGALRTRVEWSGGLSGQIGADGQVALIEDTRGAATPYRFVLASWAGAGGRGSKRWRASLCSTEDDLRYRPGFIPNTVLGGFGCREWAAQLRNPKLPYIDVTSYQAETNRSSALNRRRHYPGRQTAAVRPLIGWSSYDLPVKPVIGRHGESWFCLHDCPDGDPPGYIPNMRRWLERHNWPMPVAPKRMPVFPDKN